ncbi:hypothetical protein [Paenibacillus periandrae]|uniref:hypothetical protein n=1 Tax=Paenibacillus periandrae TaxID=1761741 RepID=UPI001F090362|nr:hypothetical protein [Paenibacillus periandrae]
MTHSGKFDITLGTNMITDTKVVLSEEGRYLHEILAVPKTNSDSVVETLQRVEQDIEKLASGQVAGIFILSETAEVIEELLRTARKHGVEPKKIYELTPLLSRFDDPNKTSNIISKVMKDGGLVVVEATDSMEPFFKNRIIHQFLQLFSTSTFQRPTEQRIPVYLTIQSSAAFQSQEMLRVFALGRSFHVGICLIIDLFQDYNQNKFVLPNIRNYTAYYHEDPADREIIAKLLRVEPHLLGSDYFKPGTAYCRYYEPHQGVRECISIQP